MLGKFSAESYEKTLVIFFKDHATEYIKIFNEEFLEQLMEELSYSS